MNPLTFKEAEKIFKSVLQATHYKLTAEIVICPPFIYLESFSRLLQATRYKLKPSLGAQDAFWEQTGAFTGEVSAEMLYGAGAKYVILGHSERRAMGENDNDVNQKIKASLRAGLIPILCVGENVRDENHDYFNLVKTQLRECLAGVSKNSIAKVIIAYEPVWAISTTIGRKDATAVDSLEMSIFIRKVLSDKFGSDAEKTKIIYGGSVNEKDAGEFLKNGGVDGLLVGRASLDAKKFSEIIHIAENLVK